MSIDCIIKPLLIPCVGLLLFVLPAWIAIRSAKHRRKFGIVIGTVWLGCSVLLTVYLGLIRPLFPQPSCLKRNCDEENDDGTWTS